MVGIFNILSKLINWDRVAEDYSASDSPRDSLSKQGQHKKGYRISSKKFRVPNNKVGDGRPDSFAKQTESSRPKFCSAVHALQMLKAESENKKRKFIEGVDISVIINKDKKSANVLPRGSIQLEHSTGAKTKTVAVIVEESSADLVEGANKVGGESLLSDLASSGVQYDVYVTTMGMLSLVNSKAARILGPKGLMPSVKNGTVVNSVDEINKLIKDIKSACRVDFKADKAGVINARIGSLKMDEQQIVANMQMLIKTIEAQKPQKLKTNYIKHIYLSSTMGAGYRVIV